MHIVLKRGSIDNPLTLIPSRVCTLVLFIILFLLQSYVRNVMITYVMVLFLLQRYVRNVMISYVT